MKVIFLYVPIIWISIFIPLHGNKTNNTLPLIPKKLPTGNLTVTLVNQTKETKPTGNQENLVNNSKIEEKDGSSTGNMSSSDRTPKSKYLRFTNDWRGEFPTCSVSNNKHLSPVNINTKEVIGIGKRLRTLLIYAYEPITSYSLQSWYNDTENNITMSALTITLDDRVFFDAAYINGLGFNEFQLFQRAVIFFSKNRLKDGQSFHRIDGRTYPMEIMITFTNRQPYNESIRNSTQLFVLVQIQKYDNPNFFPVIEAAKNILKMKTKSEAIKNFTTELEKHTQNLTKVNELYNKGGKNAGAEKLKLLSEPVEKAEEEFKSNARMKVVLTKLNNETKSEVRAKGLEKRYHQVSQDYDSMMSNYTVLLKALGATPLDLALFQQKGIMDKVRSKKRQMNLSLGLYLGSLTNKMVSYAKDLKRIEENDKNYKELIQNATNQIEGDEKPTNGITFLNYYKRQVNLKAQIKELQVKINETKAELKKTNKSIGWKSPVDTFQITWLFPDHGGVFVYNGSSPLPPCHRIRYSVVLKNPVGISQEQFDILASIPAYEGQDHVAMNVAPQLAELGSRRVWYNAKNIQWQRDDGIHMKSIVRRKWKTEILKAKEAAAAAASGGSLMTLDTILVVILILCGSFLPNL